MATNDGKRVRVGHSPDPDDAFMFYGIAAEKVDTEGFAIEQILEDIESLNRRALVGELEVSAVSTHAYAHLADGLHGLGRYPAAREAALPEHKADDLGLRILVEAEARDAVD